MKITIPFHYHRGDVRSRTDAWGDGDLGYGDGLGGGEGQGTIVPVWSGGSSESWLEHLFFDDNGYMEFYT